MEEPANMTIKLAATAYLAAGLSVLPAIPSQKRPTISWQGFQQRLPSPVEVDAWFGDANAACLICGSISGNLEMIDFDLGGAMFDACPYCNLVRKPVVGGDR